MLVPLTTLVAVATVMLINVAIVGMIRGRRCSRQGNRGLRMGDGWGFLGDWSGLLRCRDGDARPQRTRDLALMRGRRPRHMSRVADLLAEGETDHAARDQEGGHRPHMLRADGSGKSHRDAPFPAGWAEYMRLAGIKNSSRKARASLVRPFGHTPAHPTREQGVPQAGRRSMIAAMPWPTPMHIVARP